MALYGEDNLHAILNILCTLYISVSIIHIAQLGWFSCSKTIAEMRTKRIKKTDSMKIVSSF